MKILVVLCLVAASSAGLVGSSGSIGPSGMIGPSGPVQFHQPAWAFFGNNAHAHVAALHRTPPVAPVHQAAIYEPAPAVPLVYGVDSAGCLTGPSGKVCPTGNVQYL